MKIKNLANVDMLKKFSMSGNAATENPPSNWGCTAKLLCKDANSE